MDNLESGNGYFRNRDSSWYRGEYYKGKMHGKGEYESSMGMYVGEFN